MIKSWKHKGLKQFFLTEGKDTAGINLEHKEKIETILQILNIAANPMQLNMPGFRFHKLKGKLKNVYSVTIRSNWRIIFKFDEKDAILVDYIDYH